MKICSICKSEKPLEDFPRDRNRRKDGRFPHCKACHAARERADVDGRRIRDTRAIAKRNANKELREKYLVRGMAYTVYRRYGITPQRYLQMHEEQSGACAICNVAPKDRHSRYRRTLCVDHNHETGMVRALLCDDCNKGLGCFKEDPQRLLDAFRYLSRFNALQLMAS